MKQMMKHKLWEMKIGKQWLRLGTAVLLSTSLLSGCGGISKERAEAREAGIALLESGDYEGAVAQFEAAITDVNKVTEFELDILKYRAEAEAGLGDFKAAAYTWDTLAKLQEGMAEYHYMAALCEAKAGDTASAKRQMAAGEAIDETRTATGYREAAVALADAHAKAGEHDKVREIFDELLSEGTAGAEICNRLMIYAMEEGDYETALGYAASGAAQAEGEAARAIRFNEAVCYEYLGQYENALASFQSYVQEFGNDEKAEHEIAFLVTR